MTSEGCRYSLCVGRLKCKGPACPAPSGKIGLDSLHYVLDDDGELSFRKQGREVVYCAFDGVVDWMGDRSVRAARYDCENNRTHVTTTGTLELIRKWGAAP
jgi:hypothetical protein